MATSPNLLYLATRPATSKKGAAGARSQRRRELLAIAAVGAAVRHDSGGRLLVIDLPEGADKKLLKRLPGAQLVALDSELPSAGADLDAGEALFLEALRIRHSPAFRAAKAKRKFGESPEEKLLSTGSCVRGY